ncbi:MAG TPA: hypothetical protein VNG69_08460 [Casimicrobiaceae bacterium]|nr:hypothetical protein [Casimicrobiaceae bacterium]
MAARPDHGKSTAVRLRRLREREDQRWAEWLVEALETYEVPIELVRKGTQRLRGIFRDDNELGASGDLTADLKSALWRSAHLIVVCSTITPGSAWVRAEVQR